MAGTTRSLWPSRTNSGQTRNRLNELAIDITHPLRSEQAAAEPAPLRQTRCSVGSQQAALVIIIIINKKKKWQQCGGAVGSQIAHIAVF